MGKKINWTDEQIREIENLYLYDLWSLKELGRKYSCSDITIKNLLKREGWDIRSGKEQFEINDLQEKDKQLIFDKYQNGDSLLKIAKEYKVCSSKVKKIILARGGKIRSPKDWLTGRLSVNKYGFRESTQEKMVEMYLENVSLSSIGDKFGCCAETAKRIILSRVEKRRYPTTKYTHNRSFFKIENLNELSEYWFGFILADGNVYEPKNRLQIGLSIVDIEHLKKFQTCISSDHLISLTPRRTCNLVISSEELCTDLAYLGRRNFNKSKINIPITRHILRGFIDGDGTIAYYSDKGHVLYFLGGFDILFQINTFLDERFNCGEKTIHFRSGIYEIRYSGYQALDIVRWIYQDADFLARLDRKYQKYLEYFLSSPREYKRKNQLSINTHEQSLKTSSGFSKLTPYKISIE